jgi:flagellar biosynthesis component FlhA
MGKLSIIREFWHFLLTRKSWWLMPIVITLLILGALIVITQGAGIAPFVYSFF